MKLKKIAKVIISATLIVVGLGIFLWQLTWVLSSTIVSVTSDVNSVPDFKNFYNSVLLFKDTANLYPQNIPFNWSINGSQPVANLPFLIISKLSIERALELWLVVSLIGLGFTCAWLLQVYPVPKKYLGWCFLLLFSSSPFFMAMYRANWGLLLTFFVIGAWYFLRQGQEIKGGLFLGLSLLIRFHPFIILFYLLITKKWKASLSTIGTIVVLNVVALPIFGLDTYLAYLKQAMQIGSATANNRWEHSILGLISNFNTLLNNIQGIDISTGGRWFYYCTSIITVGVVLFLARKVEFDRAYSLAIIAGLLIVIPSGTYYQLLLLLPIAVLWSTHRLVCILILVRLVAHNSTLFINFGIFDNLFWNFTMVVGETVMLICLYQSCVKPKDSYKPNNISQPLLAN